MQPRTAIKAAVLGIIGFWIFINLPPWGFLGGYSTAALVFDLGTVGVTRANPVFPLTYGAAIFTFVFSFVRFKKYLGTGWLWPFLFALTTPFAFVATFEVAYQNLKYFIPGMFETNAAGEIILFSWILLGFATMPYWKVSSAFYVMFAMDVLGFAIWFSVGYPQIYQENSLQLYAIGLNAFTKLCIALTFQFLIFEGTQVKGKNRKKDQLFQ
jgi:hypothetical protein